MMLLFTHGKPRMADVMVSSSFCFEGSEPADAEQIFVGRKNLLHGTPEGGNANTPRGSLKNILSTPSPSDSSPGTPCSADNEKLKNEKLNVSADGSRHSLDAKSRSGLPDRVKQDLRALVDHMWNH
jgi:hypothetical protein